MPAIPLLKMERSEYYMAIQAWALSHIMWMLETLSVHESENEWKCAVVSVQGSGYSCVSQWLRFPLYFMCVLCLESLILTAHDMTWDTHMYSTHAAILEPRSFCLLIKNHSCTAFCSGSACLEHAALLLVSLLVLLSVWFVLGLFLVKANVNVHLHVGYYLHSFFYAWQCLKLGCKHFFFI